MVDRVSPLPQHDDDNAPRQEEHISHAASNQAGRSGVSEYQRQNDADPIHNEEGSAYNVVNSKPIKIKDEPESPSQHGKEQYRSDHDKNRDVRPSSERSNAKVQKNFSPSNKSNNRHLKGQGSRIDRGHIQNRAENGSSQKRRLKGGKISKGRTQNDWSQNSKEMHKYRGASYAALDLGTNNCRLLIARPEGDGFTIIDAFSRVVRLGEGLAKSGRISEEAMNRAVEALAVCAEKLKRRNVTLSRSVATEACRQADNGVQFIERVRKVTGIVLDIISPEEEARLAVLGCHVLLSHGNGPALIFDIGGGSTELVLVSTDADIPEIIEWISIPWGVVTLTESEPVDGESDEARMKAYRNMCNKVGESFAEFGKRLPMDGDFRTLGTSGTITTLASVYLGLPFYNRSKVDGITVPADAMREISQDLARKSPQQRALQPCIGEQRSDLVVAGCAILEGILDIWPAQTLGVADRGIREGILRALMKNEGSVSLRSKK